MMSALKGGKEKATEGKGSARWFVITGGVKKIRLALKT